MSTESPFKFLDSYSKDDKEIFFGRDSEIEELYNKVFHGKTLFVYGDSGTGKSSLIQCGLANKFNDEDWLPINVRRGENINKSLITELEKTTLTEVKNVNGSFSKNLIKFAESIYLDYFKPIYFIFDQFEELYLLGDKKEWEEFIFGVKQLSQTDLAVHFIFVIRAEYLHFMTEFEEEIPGIFNNKLRIEKITTQRAIECIKGPCEVFGIEVESGFPENLIKKLSPTKSEIELTYLQVFLDRIYMEAKEKANGSQTIEFKNLILDEIGQIGDVLSDFLDIQIASSANPENTLTILKAFVTLEGTRKQLNQKEILESLEAFGSDISEAQSQDLIQGLVNKRILRDKDENERNELRHDSLALRIYEKITIRERELIEVRQFLEYGLAEYNRRGFLLNEHDLLYIEIHLEKLKLSGNLKKFVDESTKSVRKKRRTRKQIIGIITIIVILLITSVYGFFDSQMQRKAALLQKGFAEESAQEAEKQKLIAQQNEQLAVTSQQRAVASQKLAEENAGEASRQASIADASRIDAEEQKSQALLQRQIAIDLQVLAESNAEEALVQKNIADEERQNAERLRILSLAQSLGARSIQSRDTIVKSFMAAQAFQFVNQFGGDPLENEIFNGLYQSTKFLYGSKIDFIRGQVHEVKSLAIFQDQIVSVSSDGRVLMHSLGNLSNDSKRKEFDLNALAGFSNQFPGQINAALILDQNLIAGTEDGKIIVLDLLLQKVIKHSQVNESNDGIWKMTTDNSNSLFTISLLGNIQRWNIEGLINDEDLKGDLLYSPDSGSARLNSVETDKDGNLLFSEGSNFFTLKVDEKDKKVPVKSIKIESAKNISRITLDPTGSILAVGFEDGNIQLFDYREKELISSLPGHSTRVSDIAFNREGTLMASGSFDKTMKIWNLRDISKLPTVIDDFDSWIVSIIFSDDGSMIFTGEENGNIRYLSIVPGTYYSQLCTYLGRNMTPEEWAQIVGDEFHYSETCLITPPDNHSDKK